MAALNLEYRLGLRTSFGIVGQVSELEASLHPRLFGFWKPVELRRRYQYFTPHLDNIGHDAFEACSYRLSSRDWRR